jgi:hypothetical protein
MNGAQGSEAQPGFAYGDGPDAAGWFAEWKAVTVEELGDWR